MTITYTVVTQLKNIVQTYHNISNVCEGSHGIYFNWEGTKIFINWNVLATYALTGDDENDT